MFKATLTKELIVKTPNEKGVAAKVVDLIAHQANVNIQTGWAAGLNGQGYFGFLTDDNQKAITALKGDFPDIKESEILLFNTNDAIGEIAEITKKLSNSGLDIHFLQATYLDSKPVILLDTDNNTKALTLFS